MLNKWNISCNFRGSNYVVDREATQTAKDGCGVFHFNKECEITYIDEKQ